MSIWHWIILGALVLLLFGKGKISDLMGDVAKGIKSFKKGMAEDDAEAAKPLDPSRPLESARPVGAAPGSVDAARPDAVRIIEHQSATTAQGVKDDARRSG